MKKIYIFLLGLWECRHDITTGFYETNEIETYDKGRNLGRKLFRMERNGYPIYKATYYDACNLIPESWSAEGFWGYFSDGAPFSWGDNNITLVTVERFIEHFDDVMGYNFMDDAIPVEEVEDVRSEIMRLGPNTYIALEC